MISGKQVDLSWSIPDDGGSTILGYVIQSRVNNGPILTLETSFGDATSTTYSDTTLSTGDEVKYRIAAINAKGQAPYSNVPTLVTKFPSLDIVVANINSDKANSLNSLS